MSKRSGLLLFVLLATLFLIANHRAYRSYFQDDEIDNLSWAPYAPFTEYLKGALTPRFQENNFRPMGHFYFHAAENFFGLEFPKYVAVIHLFHLLNVWLVWMVARRLGASALAASTGTVFFAFHMALFDAFWKPMYVFDVLCATFCLSSLLLYSRGRWVWSFVSFWLAYKSKELAVMLPLVLGCYEIWFGARRWKPLILFFVASLSFGLQGLLLNPNKDNEYTFRFTLAALSKTGVFYASRVFLAPYLGFLLPLAALVPRPHDFMPMCSRLLTRTAPIGAATVRERFPQFKPILAVRDLVQRNRRTWFGLAMMGLFFFPLLFLPGRLFSAYCYVPFTGLAIAVAGMVEGVRPVWLAVLVLAWAPIDIHSLRVQQRATLARADEVREWVTALGAFAKTKPEVDGFVYAGAPAGFARWGVEGAVKYLFKRFDANVHFINDPEAAKMLQGGKVAVLRWDVARRKLEITSP